MTQISSGPEWTRSMINARARRAQTAERTGIPPVAFRAQPISHMNQIQMDGVILRDLLKEIIGHFTNNAERLDCQIYCPADALLVLQLRTERSDHRKIIGREASTLRALNHLFQEIGKTQGLVVDVRLNLWRGVCPEPDWRPWDEGVQYDSQPIITTLESTITMLCARRPTVTAENIPGGTSFNVRSLMPISDRAIDALNVLLAAASGKARRKFYLYFLYDTVA